MINDDHELNVTKAIAERYRTDIAELEHQCEIGNRTLLREAQLAGLQDVLSDLENQIIAYENKKDLTNDATRQRDPESDRGSLPEETEVRSRHAKPVKAGKT